MYSRYTLYIAELFGISASIQLQDVFLRGTQMNTKCLAVFSTILFLCLSLPVCAATGSETTGINKSGIAPALQETASLAADANSPNKTQAQSCFPWWLILIYVAALIVVVCVPMVLDLILAYCKNKSGGTPGLARTTMALGVVVILGIAVIHVLVFKGCEGGCGETIKNVLGMLSATLASITGFYFGSKAMEKKTEDNPASPSGQSSPKDNTPGKVT
jgi:hypothetical protein